MQNLEISTESCYRKNYANYANFFPLISTTDSWGITAAKAAIDATWDWPNCEL